MKEVSMLILSNANVGIGTTDPKTSLDIKGKIFSSSGLGGVPENGLYGSDGTRLILWLLLIEPSELGKPIHTSGGKWM
jgi:hypothetical protein